MLNTIYLLVTVWMAVALFFGLALCAASRRKLPPVSARIKPLAGSKAGSWPPWIPLFVMGLMPPASGAVPPGPAAGPSDSGAFLVGGNLPGQPTAGHQATPLPDSKPAATA